MPKTFRPDEVSWWFQHGRRGYEGNNIPTISSIGAFETSWIKWWKAVQPQWRDTQNWPFEKDDATGKDWGNIPNGGKDGIFVIVISLAWWVSAPGSSGGSKLNEALDNVTWVINCLIRYLSTNATASDSPPATTPESPPATTPESPPATPSPKRPRKRSSRTKSQRLAKRARV